MTSERILESSETDFIRRFSSYAAEGLLYPQREGDVLMEFSSAGRVLYLFDRCGPYAVQPGKAKVIVQGILDLNELEYLEHPAEESLQSEGISGIEGIGQIRDVWQRSWVIQARLPLILSDYENLPEVTEGTWIRFKTVPPLHGFVIREEKVLSQTRVED